MEYLSHHFLNARHAHYPGGPHQRSQYSCIRDGEAGYGQTKLSANPGGIGGRYVKITVEAEFSRSSPRIDNEPSPFNQSAGYAVVLEQCMIENHHYIRIFYR